MALIGLSGYARSGKDTLAAKLVERYRYRRVSFADKVKELALLLYPDVAAAVGDRGWEEAKQQPEVRQRLQAIGEGVRNVLGEDVWVSAALQPLDALTVVSDVRYPNEAAAIQARGGLVVRVERPGIGPVNGHVSESAMDNWPFDTYVKNDGTIDDLDHAVDLLDALAHEVRTTRPKTASTAQLPGLSSRVGRGGTGVGRR